MSSSARHVALLPGLDGTGELFAPILPYLTAELEVSVVRYSKQTTFEAFVDAAREQLPRGVPLALVGESFSGPIAIALLAEGEFEYLPSVLVATFCTSPRPLLTRLSRLAPEALFAQSPLSRLALDYFATGADAEASVRRLTHTLLDRVEPSDYRRRIQIIDEVDVSDRLDAIQVPMLYIRASADRIVPRSAADRIARHLGRLRIAEVQGPHMIMQTRPGECAALILEHLAAR